ncbi:MAG: hypothetical protein GVY33_08070 [Alphaproteobacteria bacterium]|jgi:hypothetical protein|nr:hypothetical protein [Alphaproteobacteria bacterium]
MSARNHLSITVTLLFCSVVPAIAADNALLIEQIGDGNRALVQQNGVPDDDEVDAAFGAGTMATRFEVVTGATLGGLDPNAAPFDGASVEGTPKTLGQLLDGLGGSAGSGNRATVVQDGANNRALAVQRGNGNTLRTEQSGSGNLGVHLQTGDGNDTKLLQTNGGNTNALIARGGVVGADGNPLTLHATGNVDGFSMDVAGPQSYSAVTVDRKTGGGYNITLAP